MVSTRPELRGTFGMVASTHWLASSAGMAVLERGGNAFDAAVAAGFVLQVVEPHMNGPGGDMPAIVYSADADRVSVVCGQGPAPQAATVEELRRIGVEMVPGTGLLAACVPGAFGGWMLMLRDLGTWRLRDVMEFAIRYADDGFPLVPAVTSRIADVESIFRDEWPDSGLVYLPGGRVPRPGELFRNRRLAATFARLVREGEAAGSGRDAQIDAATRAWYEGFVAAAIDDYFTSAEVLDDTGMRHAGLLRGADLAAWSAGFEAPASLDYGDWRVFKTGQWGQGPVFLQQLQLLAGFDLTRLDPSGADFIHLVVESAKLAFADRDAWYGCPGDADDVVGDLLDPAYAARRRALIGETASHELRPGAIRGRPGVLPPLDPGTGRSAGGGEPTAAPVHAGDTCHVDVVDRWGNLVSATPSGGWLQSSPVIPDLGFCMGTRAQMFTLAEGHPNTLAPGKRPRTTLSPTLAIRDERSRLAFGTPGGDQQDQWSLTFFVRLVAGDRDMQQLIDLPMFHTTSIYNSFAPHGWTPGRLVIEDRLGSGVALELSRRGHDVEIVPGWSLGRLSAVEHDLERGLLRAAANPRGMQGYAVGR